MTYPTPWDPEKYVMGVTVVVLALVFIYRKLSDHEKSAVKAAFIILFVISIIGLLYYTLSKFASNERSPDYIGGSTSVRTRLRLCS